MDWMGRQTKGKKETQARRERGLPTPRGDGTKKKRVNDVGGQLRGYVGGSWLQPLAEGERNELGTKASKLA